MESTESLYIIIKEKDLEKITNQNICFSLCPFIKEKNNIKVIYPDPLNSFQKAEGQLKNSQEIFNIILSKVAVLLEREKRILLKELIKPYLDLKLSIYQYLNDCIPKRNSYKLLVKGKWKLFKNKSSLIFEIENIYSNEKGNISYYLANFTKSRFNILQRTLAYFQTLLIKKILKNKCFYILSCKKSYFMPKIFEKLNKKNRNIISYNQTKNSIKLITIFFKQFSYLIFPKKPVEIEFFMIPIIKYKKIKISHKIFKNKKIKIDKQYFFHLLKDLEKYINLSYGYKDYGLKLFGFSKNNNSNAIFHTNRFPDLNSLCYNFYKLGIKQHLISHGTHTIQKTSKSGKIVAESLSMGMLSTNIPKVRIYSQSKFSDDYLSHNNIPFKRISPLNNLNLNKKKDKSVFNILSAGSVKQLGARRYYFESSFEYIYCINNLCKKLYKLDFEIQLTIRIREVKNEINQRILEKIANQFKGLVKISNKKSLTEDILESDCLIALSSTTLEEAINSGIPSMSYGLSRYNHFSFYSHDEYQINKNLTNYSKLKKIEEILGRKFTFFEQKKSRTKDNFLNYIS